MSAILTDVMNVSFLQMLRNILLNTNGGHILLLEQALGEGVKRGLILLQKLHLPRALDQDSSRIIFGPVNTNSSRVISTVLESLQTSNQNVKNLLPRLWCQMIEVSKYSTHTWWW